MHCNGFTAFGNGSTAHSNRRKIVYACVKKPRQHTRNQETREERMKAEEDGVAVVVKDEGQRSLVRTNFLMLSLSDVATYSHVRKKL